MCPPDHHGLCCPCTWSCRPPGIGYNRVQGMQRGPLGQAWPGTPLIIMDLECVHKVRSRLI